MNANLQDALRKQLHELFPEAKDASGKREVTINCPLCEREGKPDHGRHMYISLGFDDKPPMYNCFKSTTHRGILSQSFLEEFSKHSQYIDTELMENLEKENKRVSNLGAYRLNRNKQYGFFILPSQNNALSDAKLRYINNRLGLALNYQDLKENKIILNISDLLRYNSIKTATRSEYIMNFLNTYFLGFMTNTNGSIIMKNISDPKKVQLPESIDSRYIKYNLVDNAISGYYVIPSNVDLASHVNIRIAEGTFDILSVFYHLCNQDRLNNIYLSIGSNAYLSAIKYFATSIGVVNATYHLYIDNDIPGHILPQIKDMISPLHEVYIHINASPGEKDFGVHPSRISEYVYKL